MLYEKVYKSIARQRGGGELPPYIKKMDSDWQLRATVGQNSSSVQMAYAYHVDVAVLAHVARRGQLDSALDERSFNDFWRSFSHFRPIFTRF